MHFLPYHYWQDIRWYLGDNWTLRYKGVVNNYGRGQVEIRGAWNILENLGGVTNILKVHRGCNENLSGYSTWKLHVVFMAQTLCGGWGVVKTFHVFKMAAKIVYTFEGGHDTFYHHWTFQPAKPLPALQ